MGSCCGGDAVPLGSLHVMSCNTGMPIGATIASKAQNVDNRACRRVQEQGETKLRLWLPCDMDEARTSC
jgi:hypothetical protein